MGGGQDLDERPIRGVRTVLRAAVVGGVVVDAVLAAQPRGHGAVVAA